MRFCVAICGKSHRVLRQIALHFAAKCVVFCRKIALRFAAK